MTIAALAVALGAVSLLAVPASASSPEHGHLRHVLLISVDGLHQSDLAWWIAHHPDSNLAKLATGGSQFTHAQTPVPSDSFPGLVAQVTGGNPKSTGIYYDDSFNHALLPAGTKRADCKKTQPGAEVTYFEAADKNPHALDAGQGLSNLPGSILDMTRRPQDLIDATQLPVDPSSCQPVYPHTYLEVNTIFEVARAAGLRTAWSDKHPAYEILNGHSGTGVQDLFTPEINSDAPTLGSSNDWTKVNTLTQQYDGYKVQAVLNEIKGLDHSGRHERGTPGIFGMNFQTVSTAQKLPVSVTSTSGTTQLPGGYEADGVTPGPVLKDALHFIDVKVGQFLAAIEKAEIQDSTAVILSAKHGQSPQDPAKLTRIKDSTIFDALNAEWAKKHPKGVQPLVLGTISDDGTLIWLNDRSQVAADFAKQFLLGFSGTGNDINGNPKSFTHAGLAKVFAGEEAAEYFGVQPGDPRVPDVFGISQVGVVFTGGMGKIAEHGGANPQDRDVPLVVWGHGIDPKVDASHVETTQIAPTILQLLGLDPHFLKAVQIEHTAVLPVG